METLESFRKESTNAQFEKKIGSQILDQML
jgi:hypothetical protein